MDPARYQAFGDALLASLAARPEVLGLVAVGSFAEGADAFSDHDFFVITRAEAAEALRQDVTWLPEHDRLVLVFRETAHGVKAVYDDGHLVEFAVFTPDEIALARVNRRRVLLDRADVAERIAEAKAATERWTAESAESDERLVGQFLTALLVGVGRHRRGERVAGAQMVLGYALRHFLVLLARHVPADRAEALDDLDPFRRVEIAYPEVAAQLDALLVTGDLPRIAAGLLDLGERLFGILAKPPAWTTIRRAIGG
jgi:hypothetical protein